MVTTLIYNSQIFHNVHTVMLHEILWDQHVYLYQPALTTKNIMNWFWAKNEKVKKKRKNLLILNAEFTEKENYTELLDMLH